jgi:hypothetical protein
MRTDGMKLINTLRNFASATENEDLPLIHTEDHLLFKGKALWDRQAVL